MEEDNRMSEESQECGKDFDVVEIHDGMICCMTCGEPIEDFIGSGDYYCEKCNRHTLVF